MITKTPSHIPLGSKDNRRERRGAVLVAALVCLLIVMALLGAMLQGALRARRQLHAERDLRQAELLLQAGMDRAADRLANDADYRGETWDLPAASIVGGGKGQATIEASRSSDDEPWRVRVISEYPLGDELSIRRSRICTIPSQNPRFQE